MTTLSADGCFGSSMCSNCTSEHKNHLQTSRYSKNIVLYKVICISLEVGLYALKMISRLCKQTKNRSTTTTDSSGNALSYKITLNTELTMTNIFSDQVLANENITLSESYKVQDQVYQTEKLENDVTSNLIDRVGQEFLLKISQSSLDK